MPAGDGVFTVMGFRPLGMVLMDQRRWILDPYEVDGLQPPAGRHGSRRVDILVMLKIMWTDDSYPAATNGLVGSDPEPPFPPRWSQMGIRFVESYHPAPLTLDIKPVLTQVPCNTGAVSVPGGRGEATRVFGGIGYRSPEQERLRSPT